LFVSHGEVRDEQAGMGGRRKAKTSIPIDEDVNFIASGYNVLAMSYFMQSFQIII
jgi:hypothetical protein